MREALHTRLLFGLLLLLLTVRQGWAETFHVRIENDEFLPRFLTVAPGDTVVWTNYGSDHTVTADDSSFSSTTGGGASIPVGETFTHTFTAAGRYPYYCQLHGGPGGQDMSGVVRAVIPGQNELPAAPTNLAPAAGAINQSTSPTLSSSAFVDGDADDTHAASRWVVRDAENTLLFDSVETQNLRSIALSGLFTNATYSWQVSYQDDRGGWGPFSTATSFTTVAPQTEVGTGLLGTYGLYNFKRHRVTEKASQVDPEINFNWKLGKPHRLVAANQFFIRWEGKVVPEFSETYRFRLRGDGGVRLWVNDQLIIDDWVVCRFPVYRSAPIALLAGVPVAIKLEYFDANGQASINLRWSSISQPIQIIPQARLFPLPQ